MTGRILGYAVAFTDYHAPGIAHDLKGEHTCMEYAGELARTVDEAKVYCTRPGDFVVAVCEVSEP
ncbi:hypothetical protein [Mycobacterium sp.]|uniref:hypothetical protein n=1 Tax=Mycobacterium sp. TaxID=1785 RepID=UPI002BBB730F|nr:hypothetical protein [Mycobacterium sp.]HTY35392.1 hypothetical protein [Mycobacterium sp.]